MTSVSIRQGATTREWLAVIGGILGAFMAFLDISITNSSLREIQGSLNTTLDETAWISSSYLIAEIVAIPLSGWLARAFSIRRFILCSSIVFLVSSIACGLATSLPEMVIARCFQGLSGGVLVPLASTLAVNILPQRQRIIGLSMYAFSASLAPSIGPLIGGWITSHYSWSYAFYIQVIPAGVLLALLYFCLDPQPMNTRLLKEGDWPAIFAMIVGMGSLTFVLEEGNRLDWFSDSSIVVCSVAGVFATMLFVTRQLRAEAPFINLRLYLNSSFLFACLLNACNGLFLFGNSYLTPRYFIQIQNFDAAQTGNVLMWAGIPQLLIVPFIPYLIKRVDARWLVVFGFLLVSCSAFMNSLLTNLTGSAQFMISQVIRAVGTPLIIAPLSSFAFSSIKPENVGSASSLYIVTRQFGASVGICLLGLLIDMRYHFHFSMIAQRVSLDNPWVEGRLAQIASRFSAAGVFDGKAQALEMLGRQVSREAYVMAYADSYLLLSVTALFAFVLIALLFLRKSRIG